MLSGRFNGGQSAFGVVLDAVGEGQGVADGGLDGAPGTSASALLVGHAHGPLEHGPCVAVRGVEQVKHLAGEVQRSPLVEVLGVVGPDVSLAFALPRRDDLVVGFSGRGEVVRAVDSLFVKVHVHLGLPASVEGRARLRFALGLPGQIPVHVEQVVVGSPPGPWLVVLPRLGVGVGARTVGLVLEMNVSVASVWVHTGIHHHNGAFQKSSMGGGQGLDGRHRRFRADRLVAVHVVAQVHPHDPVAAVDAFVHAPHVVCLQLVQARHVFGRRHHQAQQRTSFRGRAVFRQLPMRDLVRHVLHVIHHEVVSGEGVSQVVANEGRGRGLGEGRLGDQEQGPCGPGKEARCVHVSNIGREEGGGGREVGIKNFEFYVTYSEEDTLLNPTNSTTHLQQDVPWTHFSNFTLPRA